MDDFGKAFEPPPSAPCNLQLETADESDPESGESVANLPSFSRASVVAAGMQEWHGEAQPKVWFGGVTRTLSPYRLTRSGRTHLFGCRVLKKVQAK
jgi:hypothetical protein